MIAKLEVVKYPRGPGNYTTETVDDPGWEAVVAELRTMDAFEKPIVSLLQFADVPDADLMTINGGGNVFHIQIADSHLTWKEANDPHGPNDIVEVWTSDQGFSTERRRTWSLETTIQIVKHYFETGQPDPDIHWE